MNRRALLASGAALGLSSLAGCTGFGVSSLAIPGPNALLRMTPITDTGIAERLTYGRVSEDSESYALVSAAIDGEHPRAEGTSCPFPADRTFVFEESVYRLSFTVVDTEPATTTTFSVTLDPPEGDVSPADVVAYESLPDVDRAQFERLGWENLSSVGYGTSFRYTTAEIADSVLVPDPEYAVIEWENGTRAAFEVTGSNDAPVKTYEYSSTRVAESASQFGREIRRAHAFVLSGLSEDERAIVADALDAEDGYVVDSDEPVPNAMQELGARFRAHDDVEDVDIVRDDEEESTVDGDYLVRYDGDVYWTRVHVDE
ncbi:hypothetical protein SAMN04487950_4342 [Halogranum rubrum]|uniref:Uncharacterized protein n=1 Tax=Halogranum rubrum TaxID=553466 RepID=A0A1I4J2R5_9EURY|nr:hypothetical protein [Halogranum rubrum]SFL60517.1 hypothetical protein SAMN04487950_4342 [Halogranum rubrum]